MNKELLRDALGALKEAQTYTESPTFSPSMTRDLERVAVKLRAAINAPEPYDQQALELCAVCGWKALIPGDCCLNCTRPNPDQEPVADLMDVEIFAIARHRKSTYEDMPALDVIDFARAVLAAQKAKK